MEVDSWLTGRRGVTLPFADECGPLGADAGSFAALFRAVLDHGKARSWRHWECRGGRSRFGGVPASTSYWGHHLDLSVDEAALFARVGASSRRAVRKAESCGLTVEFSQGITEMREFYRLLCRTRRRLGVPPQPWRLFQNVHRRVLSQNQGWVALARMGRIAIAGAVYFHSGTTALYKFGASDGRFQSFRANNLVMWEAIKRHARRGFEAIDFGRTSLHNDGLRRYKLSWGAHETPIEYVRYDLRTGKFVTVPDRSSGWHSRLFRILPVSLARVVGAAVYRHVA